MTSLYKKSTSSNSCLLNYKCEYSKSYKFAVIKDLILKSKLIFSSYTIFLKELSNAENLITASQIVFVTIKFDFN